MKRNCDAIKQSGPEVLLKISIFSVLFSCVRHFNPTFCRESCENKLLGSRNFSKKKKKKHQNKKKKKKKKKKKNGKKCFLLFGYVSKSVFVILDSFCFLTHNLVFKYLFHKTNNKLVELARFSLIGLDVPLALQTPEHVTAALIRQAQGVVDTIW